MTMIFIKKNRLSSIIFIIGVIFFLVLHNLKVEETDKIFNNASFSIGEITEFFPSTPSMIAPTLINQPGQPARAHYIFFHNGIKYFGSQSSEYYTPSIDVNKGERYLVIFHKDKPDLSRILFDSPVNDSVDFIQYIANKKEILSEKKHNLHIKPIELERNKN